MRPLTKRLLVGGLVGAPLVGLAAGAALWLPRYVADRAVAALEARLGLPASIARASLRPRGVSLGGLRVGGRARGLEATAEEVAVDIGWLDALGGAGSAAVRAITARGARVDVDLANVPAAPSVRRSDVAGSASRASRPALVAEGLDVHVREGTRPVVSLRGVRGRLDADRAEATVAHIEGQSPFGTFRSAEARVRLARVDGRWAVDSIGVSEGRFRMDASSEAVPVGVLLERARAWRERFGGAPSEPETETTDGPGWLPAGATIRLPGLRLEDDEGHPVFESLTASFEGLGGGRVRSKGDGRAPGGGALAWDLRTTPHELRGEGTIRLDSISLAPFASLLPVAPLDVSENARVEAHLDLEAQSPARVAWRGRVAVRDAAISSPRVASIPVHGVGFELRGSGAWSPPSRRLEVESAELQVRDVVVDVRGALERSDDHYAIDFTATLPSTACNTAVAAIPGDLLGPLVDFSWTGRIGATTHLRIDSRDLEATILDVNVRDGCRFVQIPALADVRHFEEPFVHTIEEPDGQMIELETGPGTERWVRLRDASPFLVHAVLAHEDGGFFDHSGFAPWAIRDALVRNLTEGRYVVGASTVSMQLAKNLFLGREKTLARKLQEVLLTWWLESALGKTALLELYLNVIEYGPHVYGLRAAAEHYFGRSPAELTVAQSAFLASVLPNPKVYGLVYDRGSLTASATNRTRRLIEHMAARGRIDADALADGLAELASFRFARPGTAVPLRAVRGHARPLPVGEGSSIDWDRATYDVDPLEDVWGL